MTSENGLLMYISIHAPRKGSDGRISGSDLPMLKWRGHLLNFNPRPPQGERPDAIEQDYIMPDISLHAPRKGSDL